MADDMLARFKKELRHANEARKSDDIVRFIRDKWSLFCSSKRALESICEELEQQDSLTPTDLCTALNVDASIRFRKSKLAESAEALMDYPKSAIRKAYDKVIESWRYEGVEQDLCLVVVAGERSIVVTNIVPKPLEGTWTIHYIYEGAQRDVFLFKADKLQERLPSIFKKD